MNVLARLRTLLLPPRQTCNPDPLLIEMRCRTAEYDARLRRLLGDEAAVLGSGEERRRGA